MAQVRRSLSACAVRADLPGIQLARPFRLVSSRGVLRSLRHPSGIISHRIRRLRHRFRASNHAQRRPSLAARLYGLLALYLNLARSHHRHHHSCRHCSPYHCPRCRLHRSGAPNDPQHFRTHPVGPIGLQARFFDIACLCAPSGDCTLFPLTPSFLDCTRGYDPPWVIPRVRISLPVADTHTRAPGVGKSRVWVRVHFSLPAADTRTRALGVGKSRVWVRVRPPIPGGIPMQLPSCRNPRVTRALA